MIGIAGIEDGLRTHRPTDKRKDGRTDRCGSWNSYLDCLGLWEPISRSFLILKQSQNQNGLRSQKSTKLVSKFFIVKWCKNVRQKCKGSVFMSKKLFSFCYWRFANTQVSRTRLVAPKHQKWTNWVKKSLLIYFNMPSIPLIGTPGAKRHSLHLRKATSWFFFLLDIPLVTGVMLWKGSPSKTQR